MDPFIYIAIGIVLFLLLSSVFVMLYITVPIAKRVYFDKLVRTENDKWGHECSAPDNEEQVRMWNMGLLWSEEHKDKMVPVTTVSSNLTLYGEYYDFKSDSCVIILPGRCECLKYSYFYAPAYSRMGMNVLVVDSRGHGKSEGKYSTAGIMEAEDLKAWARFVRDKFNVRKVWLHGVCVGGAASVIAAGSRDCPEVIEGIVTDGCFTSMRETFKQHMIYEKRPVFPVLDLIMLNYLKHAKVNVYKVKPIKSAKNIKCRVLFLFTKKDVFSTPKQSKKLFEVCSAKDKKLVWFDEGLHSHIRINNLEKYDEEIIKFVTNE